MNFQKTMLKEMPEEDQFKIVKAWLNKRPLWFFLTTTGEWRQLEQSSPLSAGTAYSLCDPSANGFAGIWDFLKDDIKWLAMDMDGTWYGYNEKPNRLEDCWGNVSGDVFSFEGMTLETGQLTWDELLLRRP